MLQNNRGICEVNWVVEMPLNPTNPSPIEPYDRTEVPIRGMIAMALNGVPAFGPQESDSLNAVEATESNKMGANYWYGHSGANSGWHVHVSTVTIIIVASRIKTDASHEMNQDNIDSKFETHHSRNVTFRFVS